MNALELKQKTTKDLLNIAEEHGLKHVSRQKKADIIFNILKYKLKLLIFGKITNYVWGFFLKKQISQPSK